MPAGLRFCRNCGFRLGEGSAEYTETVRFQNAPPVTLPGYSAPVSTLPRGEIKRRRGRMSGMTWMFIGLLIFFITAGAFTAIVKRIRPRFPVNVAIGVPKSYVGVDGFETADGNAGVTFDTVEPPDGPADKAGLVGGDIITMVDGRAVRSEDDMTEIMSQTPIGKTVDLVYLRDGETKNTKLTTINREELRRLSRLLADRPEGIGRFGYDDDESERVEIPGTKMFGIRLDQVDASLPADMAGIKTGDIVIEFAGVPIRTPQELRARVRRAIPYQKVDVVVLRGGERLTIPVKMGKL